MVLDLKDARGRQVLKDLFTEADALIESNRPGVMASLDLDYAALETVSPRIKATGIGSVRGYLDTNGPVAAWAESLVRRTGSIPIDAAVSTAATPSDRQPWPCPAKVRIRPGGLSKGMPSTAFQVHDVIWSCHDVVRIGRNRPPTQKG